MFGGNVGLAARACRRCRLGEAGDAALVRHEGRGSEGFLEHVFKRSAKELFGLDVHEVTYKSLRWEVESRRVEPDT